MLFNGGRIQNSNFVNVNTYRTSTYKNLTSEKRKQLPGIKKIT